MKLKGISLGLVGVLLLAGGIFGSEPTKKTPKNHINGTVISERFTEGETVRGGMLDKVVVKAPFRDMHEMLVRTNDGRNFLYRSKDRNARSIDMLYDKGSKVMLPSEDYKLEKYFHHEFVKVTELHPEITESSQ